ncbi:MAG: GGDEF domain-containing protein, partial [Oscillospiraceae bacterium]|nr:GGDEF domain-containing protein [Oscillospiraceae bacterium]
RTGFHGEYGRNYDRMLTEGGASCISLIICDIDFFKKVNDTYGHNAGDAVLRHVAGIFSNKCPDGAEVYRWGGEEFIWILPDKDLAGAAETAEVLRIAIENSMCRFEELEIKITMSFGCTQIDTGKTIENNISAADEKLYKAKESGRNIVIS